MPARAEKGSGLIVVILVLAFMMAVGLAVLTVTSTGSRVSGNVRNQEEAFNAAEAGFEASLKYMEDLFSNGTWTSFDGHYLETPAGVDLPADDAYFRKKTDEELLGTLTAATDNVIFYNQPFVKTSAAADDTRFAYTAFLIDDEAGGGTSDPGDALLVCIGARKAGSTVLSTSRLEILLAF